MMFKENERDFRFLEFSVDDFRRLLLYANAPVFALAAKLKELAINATYGSNNARYKLFGMIAKLTGPGYRSSFFSQRN